jgi:hypothetical protein
MSTVEHDLLEDHLDVEVLEAGYDIVHKEQEAHLRIGVMHDLLVYPI